MKQRVIAKRQMKVLKRVKRVRNLHPKLLVHLLKIKTRNLRSHLKNPLLLNNLPLKRQLLKSQNLPKPLKVMLKRQEMLKMISKIKLKKIRKKIGERKKLNRSKRPKMKKTKKPRKSKEIMEMLKEKTKKK